MYDLLQAKVDSWALVPDFQEEKKHPADKQTLQNSLGVRCPHSRRI